MFLALVCWIVVGAIVGGVAAKFVNVGDDDPRLGIVVGAVAAAVGGFAFRLFSHTSSTGPGLWSLVIAAGVAVAVLVVWHMSRSASRT